MEPVGVQRVSGEAKVGQEGARAQGRPNRTCVSLDQTAVFEVEEGQVRAAPGE